MAVVCSYVVYLAILAGFAFYNYWEESVVLVAVVLLAFFVAGWLKKGDAAAGIWVVLLAGLLLSLCTRLL
jgi:hypothetical protein